MFLCAQKASVNAPRFTTKSPQLHHKNTTLKTHIFAKPPVKTPFHHSEKINTFVRRKVRLPLVKSKEKAQTVVHLRCFRGTDPLQTGPHRRPPGHTSRNGARSGLYSRRKIRHRRHRHRLHTHPRTAATRKAHRTRPSRTDSQP